MVQSHCNMKKRIKKNNGNVLVIYSCQQEKLLLQQNVVFLHNYINILQNDNLQKYKNVKIIFLSLTDTLKIAINCINGIFYTEKITYKTIIKIIKKHNIKEIIPVIGDNIVYNELNKIKNYINKQKIEIFYKNYFSINFDNNINIVKKSGFKYYNKREIRSKEKFIILNVVAVNDLYKNQIILDIFESGVINDNKKCFCNLLSSKALNIKNQILQKIKNISNFVETKCCIYNIQLSFQNEKDIYFEKIDYGITEEVCFSINRQQINLAKIYKNIKEKIVFNFMVKNNIIAYTCNYKDNFNIGFANSKNEILRILTRENKIISNKNLINLFSNKTLNNVDNRKMLYYCNNKIFAIKSEINDIKYKNIQILKDEYLLVILNDNVVDNVNYLSIFFNIINELQNILEKKIIFLTNKITPFLSLLSYNSLVFKYNNINELNDIVNKFLIKKAFIFPTYSLKQEIDILEKNKIKLYCYKSKDRLLINGNVNLENFCENNSIKYSSTNFNKSSIYHFLCIKDHFNNVAYETIISSKLHSEYGVLYYQNPSEILDYNFIDKINKTSFKVLNEISSCGFIKISFFYNDGDLLLNDISFDINDVLYLLNIENKNTFNHLLLSCLTNKNISNLIKDNNYKKNKSGELNLYDFVFQNQDKQFIKIRDYIKEKIFYKYKNIIF